MTSRFHTDRRFTASILRVVAGTLVVLQVSGAQAGKEASDDTLAVVGTHVITAEEFGTVYADLVRSSGLTDNLHSRGEVLRNLIEDRVLIEHAKTIGLDRTPEALRERERARTQELLSGFVRNQIMPRVDVSDDDLRSLYVRLNMKLKVSHLYAPTYERAEELSRLLASGVSMETLAREVFADPWLREHGGSLGYITVDEMDPAFERVAYSLAVGETSKPVRTAHGYSIIRVDDIVRNPLTTEMEFARAKERLMRFARKRAFEEALRSYTASLRMDLHVQIDEEIVARLVDAQVPAGGYRGEPVFSSDELRHIAVRSDVTEWTTGELLEVLEDVPVAHRRWVRSGEDLTDMIAGLILREHVRQQALAMRIDHTREFRKNVAEAFDTYLLGIAESRLKAELVFPPDSVKDFYEKNLALFRIPPKVRLRGILVDTDESAGRVRRALLSGEDFGMLARTHSIQRVTAERDGDMGFFSGEQLGRLADDCMSLRHHEWKGPFEEDGSFLFVQRIGWEEGGPKPLEECTKDIEAMLVAGAWRGHRTSRSQQMQALVPVRSFPQRLMSVTLASSMTP